VAKHSPPFPSLPSAQIRPLRNRLRQSIRDAGLTDLSPSPDESRDAFWELEPTPLIIPPEEWRQLEDGLRQRARLANAFLCDLYGPQEAMQAKIVPPEHALADPYYRRPCLGLSPDRLDPASLIRFDLVKTRAGWHVTDTHTNAPVGLSYAVQNRRFLTQEAADFYRALPDYQSVINAPLDLVDHLRRLAPNGKARPMMVFLTTGPRYPFYSEHSFLARKMGIRLAEGSDLLVLDNRVYFKTVAGLERVDVIYRRVNDAHIDPVVFSTAMEAAGIPGLMQCIRAGNVTVANAIGAGVAESRALNAYLPGLCRFFLGERLRLPSVPTWVFTDTDHVDSILERADELELLPVHPTRIGAAHGRAITLRHDRLPKKVRENPGGFVARLRLESVPLVPHRKKDPGFRLSTFVLTSGEKTSVLPGGIVNLGAGPHPRDRVGRCADAVVISTGPPTSGSLSDFEDQPDLTTTLPPPSSRAAESLFWLGRYLERAESTARMLGILDDVALEEIPAADRPKWLPLWRGLFAATGHGPQKISARLNPQRTLIQELLWRMTLDRQHPSSLLNTVGAAALNARQLREWVSPEAGRILTDIDLKLRSSARQSPHGRSQKDRAKRNRAATAALKAVLVEINACLGSTARTMLHDAGWHFMQLGKQLERAAFTAATLVHVLPEAARKAPAGSIQPAAHYRDNPELSALLRMLGSQDAYRRLFLMRSQPRFVAQLFLQQADAPRSILHNLQQMAESLAAIHESSDDSTEHPLAIAIAQRIATLTDLDLGPYFTAAGLTDVAAPLDTVLEEIEKSLSSLQNALSDYYFSHQARIGVEDPQAELKF
jgi:uncharacterized circularly permuted ATP-grasp superfamily protein/uncharacterized alpha-E superfamily protein